VSSRWSAAAAEEAEVGAEVEVAAAAEVGAADLVEVAAQPVGAVDPVEVEAVVAMEAVSGVRFRPVSGLCDYLGCFFRYDPKRSFSSASCHLAKAKTSKEYKSGRSRK
jgi:hypothetical protein